MWSSLLLLLLLSWHQTVNGDCSRADVFLQLGNQIVANNSYILYYSIGTTLQDRLYCYTDNTDCCRDNYNSDWYFPNGERILGGYEYANNIIRDGVFARSRGFSNVGLYRHQSPQQRGRFKCVLPDSSGNNCTLYANIVNQIPVINAQPVSQKAVKGDNVTFSVELSVTGFATYRWQKDNKYIKDEHERYQGTTTSVLAIINAQEEDEGNYHCVIDSLLVSDTVELLIGKFILIQCVSMQ